MENDTGSKLEDADTATPSMIRNLLHFIMNQDERSSDVEDNIDDGTTINFMYLRKKRN